MKKTSILSAILAGSLMVFGGFGCSHNDQPPAGPNSVSGQATPTTGDTTVNPQGQQGYQSTTPSAGSTTTPDNSGTMDQRQPVKGTMDKNGNLPTSPSDTTKPDTTNPDTTTNPGSTIPPK